jgi:SAM-dependent methyltransferase
LTSQTENSNTNSPSSFGPVAPYYDELMQGVPYRFWLSYVEDIWKLHHLHPVKVLDLACGTGSISRLLAKRNYEVMGVDLSAGMLEAARKHAKEEALAIQFVQQDASELDLFDKNFDAVVCLFDSLNYILDSSALRSAFARIFSHLVDGGSFLFDVNTEYALAQGMFNQSCTRKDEALHYRWRSRYDSDTGICTVNMKFSFDPGTGVRENFTEVHRQRAYRKDEINTYLETVGFRDIVIYDAYTYEGPKKFSDRLFFLAKKP